MKSHHVQRNQHHCSTFSLGEINWKVHPNIIMFVMARHFCHLCKVMFLNGAMWNIRLFPEPAGATIKKSWPLTNLSATVLWFSVISLKPSFLFLLVSIASYIHSFPMLPSLSSLQSQVCAKGRIGLDQVFWKLTSQEKAFPDWISLTTHLAVTPLARKLAGQI